MKTHLAVSAIGRDRPGIVAGLTRVLFEHGANLEDTSMTRLRGDFAVLLLATLPEDAPTTPVAVALEEEAQKLELTVQVRTLPPGEAVPDEGPTGRPYTLVLYGADRPGLVHKVSEAAARHGLNVTDLRSQLTGSAEKPVYSLAIELDAPYAQAVDRFTEDLEALKASLQVELSFEPADADEM